MSIHRSSCLKILFVIYIYTDIYILYNSPWISWNKRIKSKHQVQRPLVLPLENILRNYWSDVYIYIYIHIYICLNWYISSASSHTLISTKYHGNRNKLQECNVSKKRTTLWSWWFQPLKHINQIGSFSKNQGENKKYIKTANQHHMGRDHEYFIPW